MAAAKASTHRLDPEIQAALDHLSRLLHRPKNRLINEAVKLYVQQESRKAERELEASLEAIRAYRRRDANFDQAVEGFVNAEAQSSAEDPAEGQPEIAEAPVRTRIRRLLHG